MLIVLLTLSKVYAYQEYTIGDKVTYNNVDYYVVKASSSEDEYVTLLKAEPLTVDEVNFYGNAGSDNTVINKNTMNYRGVAYNMNGYGAVTFYTEPTTVISFSENKCGYLFYKGEGVEYLNNQFGCSTVYGNSDVSVIIRNWVNDNFKYDEIHKYGLLLSNTLLDNLGYTVDDIGDLQKSESTYSWLYSNKYKYWINNNYQTLNRSVMNYEGKVEVYRKWENNLSYEEAFEMAAIRPYIELSKVNVNRVTDSNIKTIDSSDFNIGDIVEIDNIKFYVIKNSNNNNNINLIKATPLTLDEVNMYGKGSINRYTSNYRNSPYDNNGYGGVAFYSSENCNDSIDYNCKKDYASSDIKKIVDSWENSVIKNIGVIHNNYDYEVRILKRDDLLNTLGYNFYGGTDGYVLSKYAPYFLNSLKDCWTSFSTSDDNDKILRMRIGNLVDDNIYSYKNLVCPVVILTKKNLNNVKKDIVTTDVIKVSDTRKKISVAVILLGIFLLSFGILIFMKKSKNIKLFK